MKTIVKLITILCISAVIYDSCGNAKNESEVTENVVEIQYKSPIEKALKTFISNINENKACQIVVKTSEGEVTTFLRNSRGSKSVRHIQGVQSQAFYSIAGTLKGYANDVRIKDKVFLGQAEPAFNIFEVELLGKVLDIVNSMSQLDETKFQESKDGKYYVMQIPIDNKNEIVGVSKDGNAYFQSDGETEVWVMFDENITVAFP